MEDRQTDISWLLVDQEASHIFFDPVRRSDQYPKPLSAKAVQSCPAVQSFLSRTFTIRCPFDLRLRLVQTSSGPQIYLIESGTSISPSKLSSVFSLMPANEWRQFGTPVVQIATPYVFFAREPIYLNQRHPSELAGVPCSWRLIEGRYPIDQWYRPLSWAAEWIDPNSDIQLQRGVPWFNIDFERNNPSQPIRLVQKHLTDSMRKELAATKDVASYIKGTFSLFDVAKKRRDLSGEYSE